MNLIILLSMLIPQENTPKLIYIGDPMCSWCYGFSEELKTVMDHFDDTMATEYIMGGLRPYNKQNITELASFLDQHWKDVQKASGQEFNYEILQNETVIYDTEPPSRAVVIVRDFYSDHYQAFFGFLQKRFYKENFDLSNPENYKVFFDERNLDFENFLSCFSSDPYKEKVKLDFQRSAEMGVRGFPSLVLIHNGKTHRVSNGYAKAQTIINTIEQILEKK